MDDAAPAAGAASAARAEAPARPSRRPRMPGRRVRDMTRPRADRRPWPPLHLVLLFAAALTGGPGAASASTSPAGLRSGTILLGDNSGSAGYSYSFALPSVRGRFQPQL